MSAGEVVHGLSLVPIKGANELDLHEFITHVERNPIMKTQGYVVKANGWVDPSTLAYHRYVVLTIEHRSESVCTYYVRIDRRAERHISPFEFVRRLGKVKSSDRVALSYDQDQLLARSKRKEMENALNLDHPLRLDRLGFMLGVIRVEFSDYKLTKENCWAMASVILELLETEGRGAYQHGKLCLPEWAPEVRKRVRNRFASVSHAPVPITSHASEAGDSASHIEELSQSHPPPPVYLFGRDDYVQRIIDLMKSKVLLGASARLIIGGPGGIGKTSVALAIFHSPELDGTFPRNRRFFIPCQSVTTGSTFLSAIASSLDVKTSRSDALELVMEKLKAGSAPLMLLLDNGESFWFDYEIQPQARTILQHICSIPTVTLLLTIRGTEQPNVTLWDPLPLLGPLSLPHARQVFLAIATGVEPDASLDRLLRMVDYVPLAVSLLARRCQIIGESAEVLCDRWEKEHTELLKLGGHGRDDNIDISIKLSLGSPLMRNNHNALRLLSIVSHLPSGISDEACGSISLSDEELSVAQFLLRRLSLTYSPTLGWISTLEPIRAYVRRHHFPRADDLSAVDNWHIDLANTHGNYEPGDAEFSAASAILTVNSANITFILHTHIHQYIGPTVVPEAVLAFSRFLCWTRPNGDLLEKLLSAGINVLDHSTKGECLQRLGEIFQMQGQYNEAQSKLEEARSEFIDIGNRLGAAQCLQSLGNILRMRNQHEEAQLKLEKARSEFIIIGNRIGAAQCLRSLGDILRMAYRYEEAQLKLEKARSEFIVIGDRLGAVHCLQILGIMLGMQHQNEEARPKLENARSEFIIIGDQLGAAHCLQSLGEVLRMQHQYEEAQLKLEEARSEFITIGNRLGAALCLRSLGDISRMRGQPEEAQAKLEEARSEFITIGSLRGVAQCLRSLGDILQMRHEHVEAQLKLEEARFEFIIIGDRLGTAQCLQSLGDILQTRRQYAEAQLKLKEARSEFIVIDDQLGAAQCLKSLGNILQMQNQNEEAQLKLEEAWSEFIKIGNRVGAAQCIRSLGDVLRMQGQCEEARLKLEEARSEFDMIGDRLGAAQCLGSLGDILQVQGQYDEAKLKLEEARSEFIMIGNQHGAALCLQRLASILQMQNQHEEARLKLEKVCSEFTRLGLQRDVDQCRKRLDDIERGQT